MSVRACVCMRACVNSLPTSWAIAAAAGRRGGNMSSRKGTTLPASNFAVSSLFTFGFIIKVGGCYARLQPPGPVKQ